MATIEAAINLDRHINVAELNLNIVIRLSEQKLKKKRVEKLKSSIK